MAEQKKALGILVGGGPAPGINGVIAAATIEALNSGLDVYGFYEGFKYLMEGSTEHVKKLSIDDVSRIHFQGGSILRTSRANPTKKEGDMDNVLKVLGHFNVKYLVTIGGDDTAYSSSKTAEAAGNEIAVAHVPKTIDNDLPLPASVPTFGYNTAMHTGAAIVKNLMADAMTAPRWYIVVAMGRNAGHLALGIGKSAGAPLTLIPEEFPDRKVTFKHVCDIMECFMLKRMALGKDHGVAVFAEGLVEHMDPEEIASAFGPNAISRDAHGHIRLDDIELGRAVRDNLRNRFAARGEKATVINKNLGYEVRCADPIPFDAEYTRDLGCQAVRFLLGGGTQALVTFYGGKMNPMPFDTLRDPETGRVKVRLVQCEHESYQVARSYMIRLEKKDKDNKALLEKMAGLAKLSYDEFVAKFGYLME